MTPPDRGRPAPRAWVGAPFSPSVSGWALLPLRIFLGVTFTFAGMQKLANPAFYDASNPTSFQAQLKEAAQNSPIHALVGPLQHIAVPLGVVLALAEIAVGVGTLLGLWARVAAVGGLLLSLSLFLTVSFHSSPYYTGSDIVFVFAWLPLLVTGAGGVLSFDTFLAARLGAETDQPPVPEGRRELDRRAFALKAGALGTAGALGVLLAGLAAGLGRLVGNNDDDGQATTNPPSSRGTTSTTGTTGTTGADATTTTGPSSSKPPGKKLFAAASVVVGGSATFNDPATGQPAVVVQPATGSFAAFSTICPHQGCTVAFVGADNLFVCPCHGSRFNGETGALVHGPATRGLTPITIAEGPDGDLYAV
jgi:thiosulfate dehydrogenase [quinone] large subunit